MMAPNPRRAHALLASALLLALVFAPMAGAPATAEAATQAPLELIIAPDAFIETLLPLKDWRQAQGLRTDIVTISHLVTYQSSVGARDLADAIHQFVTARRASDPRLEYLLLIGDDPVVPTRTLQVANRTAGAGLSNSLRSMVSDFFFATTATDFLNGTDYGDEYPGGGVWYGISDDTWNLSAEVHVGRVPVKTQGELSLFVDRLLAWEAAPEAGSWLDRAVFALPVASPPDGWGPDDRLAYDASVAFAPAMAAAAGRGLETVALADYPGWPAGFVAGADNLSEVQLLSQWSGGASLVVVPGRDNPLSGGPGTEYAGDGSSAIFQPVARPIAVGSVTNGAKLPVALAAFGSSANFSLANDSSFERALTNPGGGAVAVVGFTGPTALSGGPGEPRAGWTAASLVVENLMAGGMTLGQALDAARAQVVAAAEDDLGAAFDPNDPQLRATVAGLTLLGDPASSLWRGAPGALVLDGPEAVGPNARTNVTFTVTSGGAPVAGATVAVSDEFGDLKGWGLTDGSGVARFELATGASNVRWNVTASAPGFVRADASVAVDSPATVAVLNPGPEERIGGTYTLSGLAGDPDANDTVTAVELSIDGGPWGPAVGAETWSLALDTLTLQNGPHELRARASDGRAWGPAARVRFNVTNPVAPAMTDPYPAVVMNEDENGSLDLDPTAHFAPTGPGAVFGITLGDAEFARATLNGTTVDVRPDPQFFGSTVLPVTVTESYGGRVSFNLSIIVLPQPDPPVLTVGSNASVREGGVITFDPRAFDPDGTTPDVRLESGPANATITGWEAPRRSAGTYQFVFAATDGLYITRVHLTIEVVEYNEPPEATISAPDRGEAGRELAFEALSLVDPDGDPVTVEWQFGDGQRAATPTTTHVYATTGDYTVTLTLSDGRDTTTLLAVVHIDPYTPPGIPPTETVAAVALASIAVMAGAFGFGLFRAARRRGPAAGRFDTGPDPAGTARDVDEDESE